MLKGETDYVSSLLECGTLSAYDALCNYDLDTSVTFTHIEVVLRKQLRMECRERQWWRDTILSITGVLIEQHRLAEPGCRHTEQADQ